MVWTKELALVGGRVNAPKNLTFQIGDGAERPILCFRNNRFFAIRVEKHHRGALLLRFMSPENTDTSFVKPLRMRRPAYIKEQSLKQ